MSQRNKWSFLTAILLAVMLCGSPLSSLAAFPMIYGVTEGSVYREFVRIYWFTEGTSATLSTNGGTPNAYSLGQQLSANGSYRVEVSVSQDDQTYTNGVNFAIDSSLDAASLITANDQSVTPLTIDFEPGTFSGNPFIVLWAEDAAGNFLQNLYIGSSAATNYMRFGNNKVFRPQAVPYWAHKVCPATSSGGSSIYVADPSIPLPEGLDGVTGATQKMGFRLSSHLAPPAESNQVRIMLEINQSYDNGWYFAPTNPIAEETDAPSGTTFGADGYFGTSNEPSLIYAVAVPLDQPGTYTTTAPIGYGHYGGRTGTLYTDFYADDNGVQRYKFDYANKMVKQLGVTVHKLPGDITGDCRVDLQDAITGLKICEGDAGQSLNSNGDVNADNKLGLPEALHVLKQTAAQ